MIKMNNSANKKINEIANRLTELTKITLKDVYLDGFQDGVRYALEQIENKKELEKENEA